MKPLRLPIAFPAPLRFRSLCATSGFPLLRVPATEIRGRLAGIRRRHAGARALVMPVPLFFRLCRQGDRRLSQLPEGPLYAYALLFDPGPTELAKPFEAVSVAPAFL